MSEQSDCSQLKVMRQYNISSLLQKQNKKLYRIIERCVIKPDYWNGKNKQTFNKTLNYGDNLNGSLASLLNCYRKHFWPEATCRPNMLACVPAPQMHWQTNDTHGHSRKSQISPTECCCGAVTLSNNDWANSFATTKWALTHKSSAKDLGAF